MSNEGTAARRPRLLLSAYACAPHRGSEPAVGWHHAVHLAEHHDVWCLTSEQHREAVEAELAINPVPGLTMVYVPVRARHPATYIGWRIQVHYYRWQRAASRTIRELSRTVDFDIAQHVSYVRCWSPSALADSGVPYVWGPVAGAEASPMGLWKGLGVSGALFELTRRLILRVAAADPKVRRTATGAAATLVCSTHTGEWATSIGATNPEVLSPSVAPDDALARPVQPPSDRTTGVRFIMIGRLSPWKGHHLAIRALAHSRLSTARLDIVGSGPQQEELQALADRLGVGEQVHFHDVSRERMFELLEEADVLVHPAIHDPGPTVLFEAMAAGRPLISLDMGSADIPDDVGVFLEPDSHAETVIALASTMSALAADPDRRRQMGRAGRKAAETTFNWTARAAQLADLHRAIMDGHPAPSLRSPETTP